MRSEDLDSNGVLKPGVPVGAADPARKCRLTVFDVNLTKIDPTSRVF